MQSKETRCLLRALLVAAFVCSIQAARAKEAWDTGPFQTEPQVLLAAAASQPRPKEPVEILLEDLVYDFDLAGRRTLTWRRVYRVLDAQAAGKPWDVAWMMWRPWYQDRPEIRARVVAADGRVADLDLKTLADSPVMQEGEIYSDARTLIAPLPAFANGSVVEVQVKVHDREVQFKSGFGTVVEFQELAPVRRKHVVIHAPIQTLLRFSVFGLNVVPSLREEGAERVLELEVGPLPALDLSESWMPRRESPGSGLGFTLARSWHAVVQEYSSVVDTQLARDDLRSEARRVVGEAKSREAAVERILIFMKDLRYASVQFGDGAYVPRTPRETLARGYGDCKDLATLLVGMLRAAGHPASVALLRARWWDIRDDVPTLNVFDHAIVHVAGKTSLWIDATDPNYRVGELPWIDQGRKVLIADARTERLELLPDLPTTQNIEHVRVEIQLAATGNGSVEEVQRPRGWFADYYRAMHRMPASERRTHWEGYFRKQYLGALSDLSETGMNSREQVQLVLRGQGTKRVVTREKFALAVVSPIRPLLQFPDTLKESDGKERIHPLQFVPMVSDVSFHVVPPTGFKARALAEPVSQQLGPATYTSSVQLRPDGSVDLGFRVDGGKGFYTKEEVAQFQRAVNALHVEKLGQVFFFSEVATALSQGHKEEAVQRGRELVAAEPGVAGHHSRLALALLELGLGDEARAVARRATEVAPGDAQSWHALGWALEHDAKGVPFHEGFDFDGALQAYRRAQALDADASILFELAVLLEHNSAGERYATDGHLDDAIDLYRKLKAGSASTESPQAALLTQVKSNLLLALLYRERFDDVLALAPEMAPDTSRDVIWVSATGALQGTEAAVAQAGRLTSDPDKRRALLAGAMMKCIQLARYSEVRQLFAVLAKESSGKNRADLERFSEFLSRLKPRSEWGIGPTDPRMAVVRLFSAVAGNAPTPAEAKSLFADEHGSVPSEALAATRKATLALMPSTMAGMTFSGTVRLDFIMAVLEFAIEGNARVGWRVRGIAKGVPGAGYFFVVLQGNEPRILGFGGMGGPSLLSGLGTRAKHLLDQGETEAARQWIVWARESVASAGGEQWQAFRTLSSPEETSSVEGLRKAAIFLAGERQRAADGTSPRSTSPTQARTETLLSADPMVVGGTGNGSTGAPANESVPLGDVIKPQALAFAEGMTRPVQLSSAKLALPSGVPPQTGLVLVKCVLTVEGTAEQCTIVKSLSPPIDQAVLDWMARQRWKPATRDGNPLRVSYVFPFRFN